MKALPKRKGNTSGKRCPQADIFGLNESPSKKEGKWLFGARAQTYPMRLNESPSKKEGKLAGVHRQARPQKPASMKALPKRKGNLKYHAFTGDSKRDASMKVPPKRKGNFLPH